MHTHNTSTNVRGPFRRYVTPVIAVAAAGAMLVGCSVTPSTSQTDTSPTTPIAESASLLDAPYTVAAISAGSGSFDLETSLERADQLVGEAADAGATLVAFGELWLPGYPVDLNFDEDWAAEDFPAYADNAIEIGDDNWKRLLRIAADHDVYVSIGYAEREGDHLYMGQSLIDPTGEAIDSRRKIRPSGTERTFFSDGPLADNITVSSTPLGRIGQLECWEHLHPQMTYPMLAQQENIHVAAWPYIPEDTASPQWWEASDVAESASRLYAINGGTWVVTPAVGRAFIMSPEGEIVAQATAEEPVDFVTATIDPSGFADRAASDASGEYSWGVLEQISDAYVGPRDEDDEHGTLNLVDVDEVG